MMYIANDYVTEESASRYGQPLKKNLTSSCFTVSSPMGLKSISSTSSCCDSRSMNIIGSFLMDTDCGQNEPEKLKMDSTSHSAPRSVHVLRNKCSDRAAISIRGSGKRRLHQSLNELSLDDSQQSVVSTQLSRAKTDRTKRRKLNCSSYLRVIGRRSNRQSPISSDESADSQSPSLTQHEPPPLSLSSSEKHSTSTNCTSSFWTTPCTFSNDFSDDEDLDIAPRYDKEPKSQRRERTMNGLDAFKLGEASKFDVDLFSDRLDHFQL